MSPITTVSFASLHFTPSYRAKVMLNLGYLSIAFALFLSAYFLLLSDHRYLFSYLTIALLWLWGEYLLCEWWRRYQVIMSQQGVLIISMDQSICWQGYLGTIIEVRFRSRWGYLLKIELLECTQGWLWLDPSMTTDEQYRTLALWLNQHYR
ncbi:protein YgfX [Photobacterium damselae]|uniref:Toxin CptA n=1 Tax=Photobacterium damselae subsp. damselae TaxID=85581 RepID=A0A7Y7UFR7_PHODD|nr:protein YgfX [Photobacterium damselae]ELI6449053.1 hypothetical protein [Photobacterium damselae]ELV7516453.1 hypothetical protein [Photobacterium damselae]MBA5684514.1 hypothetical protein [Photobacterium damselae subsp. damselae]MBF7100923.1 hypothetical protein [Photobacterium damselae]MCG9705916.1 hypothetical protein [Photobacterium damselae]